MHQIVQHLGFVPDPTGELTALPQTLAGKGRGKEGKEGRGKRGREGKGGQVASS